MGVTEADLRVMPAYTTLLAANAKGCRYLKEWRRAHKDDPSGFCVVTKPADAPTGRQRELCELSDSLFTLCFPTPRPAGDMMKRSPVIYP